MPDTQATMIVTVAAQAAANKIAAVLNEEPGGEHTFEGCRLSANGLEPATHVAASGPVCEDTLPLLSDASGLHSLLATLAAQRDRECPSLAEVELAVGAANISPNSDPFAVFSSLGLQIVAVPV